MDYLQNVECRKRKKQFLYLNLLQPIQYMHFISLMQTRSGTCTCIFGCAVNP